MFRTRFIARGFALGAVTVGAVATIAAPPAGAHAPNESRFCGHYTLVGKYNRLTYESPRNYYPVRNQKKYEHYHDGTHDSHSRAGDPYWYNPHPYDAYCGTGADDNNGEDTTTVPVPTFAYHFPVGTDPDLPPIHLGMQPTTLISAEQVSPGSVRFASVSDTGMLLSIAGFDISWLDLSQGETTWTTPQLDPSGPERDCVVSILTTSHQSNDLFIEVADREMAAKLGHPCV